jgi:uncharacterized protein YbjT (DUF2867 family)
MILVIGGTGKVGQQAVRRLAADGRPVRALVRDPARADAIRAPGVELATGDLADPASLSRAMRGADIVVLITPPDPRQVEHQGNAVAAARDAGVRRIVKLSVIGAAPDAPFHLGRWHAETERAIEASGVAWTMLRPQSFLQNFYASMRTIAGEGVLYGAQGEGRVPFVDARDVGDVAAIVAATDGHEQRIYDLTGGEAVSYGDVAARLGAALGRPVRYVDLPEDDMRRGMVGAGLPEWLADDLVTLQVMFRHAGDEGISPAVAELTGRAPRTLGDFAREFAAAARATAAGGH